MTSLSTLTAMNAAQRHLPCSINSCRNHKKGVGPYCSTHSNNKSRFGHPLGRALMPWEYKQERTDVLAFFKAHDQHPAIKAAETFITEWLQAVAAKDAPSGNSVFARLHHCVVPTRAILVEIMAVWLYSERNPHGLPDDYRLTYALARNAARLAGWGRKTYGKYQATIRPKEVDLRAAGERIRTVLAPFYINLKGSLEATMVSQQVLKADLSRPF